MAIQDSFNLSNALSSQAYAYKCWYNYNYGNNTMGISAQDMGEITQTWNSELHNWQATAMDDENAYEIEDDDFSTAKQNGRDQAEDKIGYDGKQGGQITRNVLTITSSAASFVATSAPTIGKAVGNAVNKVSAKITGKAAAKEATKEVAKEASKEATQKVTNEVTKEAGEAVGKEAGQKAGEEAASQGAEQASKEGSKKAGVSAWVSAALAIATTSMYFIKRPNKEQKEACDDLQDEMVNSQNALYSAQEDMSDAGEEVTALSDEAQSYNEEANETIEDNKSEYDTYKASYDALMEKVKSGEPLTDSEKELLEELILLMEGLGNGILETQKETSDTVDDIYGDMGTYQEDYDNAASTVGEVQGVTDYAESFDRSTQIMCNVEGASQLLNAANGIAAGSRLIASGGIAGWLVGGAAIVAGGASAAAAAPEQFKWAGEVGTEIDMREMTQDLNSTTNDIYDESISGYEGSMEVLENFELEMPEDMENPEEVVEQLGEESAEALAGAEATGEGETDSGNGLTAGAFGLTAGTRTTGGNNTNDGGDSGASGGVNPNEKDKEEK